MVKIGTKFFAPEWFDFDREEKTMYLPLEEAIERAKAAGWVVEAREVIPGTTGYQLKSPEGEYLQFAGSEESCWKKAYQNGVLSVIDEDGA